MELQANVMCSINTELLHTNMVNSIDSTNIKREVDIDLEDERLDFLDENYHSKCGEIFVSKDKEFTFYCNICNENFQYFHNFAHHVLHQKHENKINFWENQKPPTSGLTIAHNPFRDTQPNTVISSSSNCEASYENDPLESLEVEADNELPQVISAPPAATFQEQFVNQYNFPKSVDPIDVSNTVPMNTETVYLESNNEDSMQSNGNLSNSSENMENTQMYHCSACKLDFDKENDYTLHVQRCSSNQESSAAIDFHCEFCKAIFKKKIYLNFHLQKFHQKNIAESESPHTEYACEYCSEKFKHYAEYSAHKKLHVVKNHKKISIKPCPFKCKVCGKEFSKYFFLMNHERIHNTNNHPKLPLTQTESNRTGDNLKKCKYCYKLFEKESSLKLHEEVHENSNSKNSFSCKLCRKSFAVHLYLNRHILKTHRKEFSDIWRNKNLDSDNIRPTDLLPDGEPYVCEFCEGVLTSRNSLLQHLRLHFADVPFKCLYCDEKFRFCSKLRNHIDVMHYEKYAVDLSLESMATASRIEKNHYDSSDRNSDKEESIPKFPCQYCNKILKTKNSHFLHLRMHTGEKPYRCLYCSVQFDRVEKLHRHSYKEHFDMPISYEIIRNKRLSSTSKSMSTTKLNKFRSQEEQNQNDNKSLNSMPITPNDNLIVESNQSDNSDEPSGIEGMIDTTLQPVAYTKINKRQFICKFCDKIFGTKRSLYIHLRIHTGEKPYCCLYCLRYFDRADKLHRHSTREHMNMPISYKIVKNEDMAKTNQNQYTKARYTDKGTRFPDGFKNPEEITTTSLVKDEMPEEHICDICGRELSSRKSLMYHISLHKGEKPFKCFYCKEKMTTLEIQRKHTIMHHPDEPMLYQIVRFNTVLNDEVQKHQNELENFIPAPKVTSIDIRKKKLHEYESKFKCKFCHKVLHAKRSLLQHLRLHTGEKPFKCLHCHEKFIRVQDVKKHSAIAHSEIPLLYEIDENINKLDISAMVDPIKDAPVTKPSASGNLKLKLFKCKFCQKVFKSKICLQTHLSIHLRSKQKTLTDLRSIKQLTMSYRCRTCGSKYYSKLQFIIHQRTHLGIRPYKCDICNADYHTNSYLVTHKRNVHKIETPIVELKCDHCSLTFNRQYLLDKHNIKIHNINIPKCDMCEKTFDSSAQLNFHVKKIHCVDDYIDTDESSLDTLTPTDRQKRRMKSRQTIYENSLIETITINKKPVKRLRNIVHYKCIFCTESMASFQHLRKHNKRVHGVSTELPTYECKYCKRKLASKYNISVHLYAFHVEKVRHKCHLCRKGYDKLGDYREHRKFMHDKFEEDENDDTQSAVENEKVQHEENDDTEPAVENENIQQEENDDTEPAVENEKFQKEELDDTESTIEDEQEELDDTEDEQEELDDTESTIEDENLEKEELDDTESTIEDENLEKEELDDTESTIEDENLEKEELDDTESTIEDENLEKEELDDTESILEDKKDQLKRIDYIKPIQKQVVLKTGRISKFRYWKTDKIDEFDEIDKKMPRSTEKESSQKRIYIGGGQYTFKKPRAAKNLLNMPAAIKACLIDKMPASQAAKKYNLTASTVWKYVKREKEKLDNTNLETSHLANETIKSPNHQYSQPSQCSGINLLENPKDIQHTFAENELKLRNLTDLTITPFNLPEKLISTNSNTAGTETTSSMLELNNVQIIPNKCVKERRNRLLEAVEAYKIGKLSKREVSKMYNIGLPRLEWGLRQQNTAKKTESSDSEEDNRSEDASNQTDHT